jgi:membrane protein
MSQAELPLYPKISSIYNKIMQFGLALLLIVVIGNLWVFGLQRANNDVDKQFYMMARHYVTQASLTAKMFFEQNKTVEFTDYVNSLAGAELVAQAVIYDPQGKVLASSVSSSTINEYFGVDAGHFELNRPYIPFAQEIRGDKLYGYIRLNLNRNELIGEVKEKLNRQFEIFRLLLICSGVAGMFLIRSFNRISSKNLLLRKNTSL